jgi:uncharacterized protein YceK
MRRRSRLSGLLALVLSLALLPTSGCGGVLVRAYVGFPGGAFCGVQADGAALVAVALDPTEWLALPFVLVDVPLNLVVDLVLLPFSIEHAHPVAPRWTPPPAARPAPARAPRAGDTEAPPAPRGAPPPTQRLDAGAATSSSTR